MYSVVIVIQGIPETISSNKRDYLRNQSLGSVQPIAKTADVLGNYPNHKKTSAEKEDFII